MNSAFARVLRWTLFVVGLGAIGYCSYIYADTAIYQSYQNWAFDEQLHGRTPNVRSYLSETTPLKGLLKPAASNPEATEGDVSRAAPPRSRQQLEPALIGRIEIPRLQVHAIVREGDDDGTLRRAVGHIPSSALPGHSGNVALAGHRDTFFRGLRAVRKNDHIKIRTLDGEFEYVVDSLRIVSPNYVQVLAATAENTLTLVTCYPFNYVGNAPKRFIVRARQIRGTSANTTTLASDAPVSSSSSTP